MNKKFKNRNRGLVTFGIVALSAVALTASGFAAWVISGKDSQTAEGNIQVDTVENNNHTLTVALNNANITYGSKKTGNVATWLTNSNAESLTATATVTVANVKADTITSDVSSILENPTIKVMKGEDDVTATTWASIADSDGETPTDGLVGKLPSLTYSEINQTGTTVTCKIVIEFTWGRLFGSKNPCEYYYGKTAAEKSEEASTRLNQLYSALNGCKYVLTVASK